MKKGSKIAEIAVVSIILYTLLLLAGIKYLKIYTIPISMACAQIYNIISYTKFVKNRLNLFDKELVKTIALYVILGISLVSLNFFIGSNFFIQLYSNFIVICLWLLFVGKDVLSVFRLVTQRGEIK